jgi:hypothetical protein
MNVKPFGMLIDELERDFSNANADAHLFPSWYEIRVTQIVNLAVQK